MELLSLKSSVLGGTTKKCLQWLARSEGKKGCIGGMGMAYLAIQFAFQTEKRDENRVRKKEEIETSEPFYL